MTAFEAMFPTHAALADVPSPSAPNVASGVGSHLFVPFTNSEHRPPSGKTETPAKSVNPTGISILKYVIVYDPIAQEERAIIFDTAIQHSTMVPLGHRPVSAGSLVIARNLVVVASIGSESLHLDPRPQDKEILSNFLAIPSLPTLPTTQPSTKS